MPIDEGRGMQAHAEAHKVEDVVGATPTLKDAGDRMQHVERVETSADGACPRDGNIPESVDKDSGCDMSTEPKLMGYAVHDMDPT